jgi:hypothetical protein
MIKSFFTLLFLCLFLSSCKPQSGSGTNKSEKATVSSFAKTLTTSQGQALIYAINPSGSSAAYFGYFGDGMYGEGTGDYINSTASSSNVHFISGPFDADSGNEWVRKASEAVAKKQKIIIMVAYGIFKWQSLELSESRVENIRNLEQKLYPFKKDIIAAYLIDEPVYANQTNQKPLPVQDVYKNLAEGATLVKSYFPDAAVFLTEAAPAIKYGADSGPGAIAFPAEIDWVGLNCYLFYAECRTTVELDALFAKLYKNLLPNQRMLFTLDSQWPDTVAALQPQTQMNLISRNESIMKFAEKYQPIAYFPFIYQSATGRAGAEDMPIVKKYIDGLAPAVLNGTFKAGVTCIDLGSMCEGADSVHRDSCNNELGRVKNSSLCSTGTGSPSTSTCSVLEPKCEGNDYVRRDSCGNEIDRWKNAPAPYCKAPAPTPVPAPVVCNVLDPKCEGTDYVRRDSCGKEIDRWKNAPAPYCKAPAPTPVPAPVVCNVLDPKCEGTDYVRRDSCGKEIDRWKNAPAPYCPAAKACTVLAPKCEGRDSVRRDSCGNEIERWKNAPYSVCPL